MSKQEKNVVASTEPAVSAEHERRRVIVENYARGNPVKFANKKLLGKDGKTLVSLTEWVDEA